MKNYNFFMKYISSKLKALIILLLFIIVFNSFLSIWPITLMKKVVDLAQNGNLENINTILFYGILYIITQIFNAFLKSFSNFLSSYTQTDIGAKLQSSLYSKLLKADLLMLQKKDSVTLSNSLIEDTNLISNNFIIVLRKLFYSVLTFVIGLFYMFSIAGNITFFILPLGLFTSLSIRYINKKSQKNLNSLRDKTAKNWKSISEGIRGISVIRVYKHEDSYNEKIKNTISELRETTLSQRKLEGVSAFINSALFMATIGIIMIVSAIYVVNGSITLGALTAIMMYNHMLVDPLLDLLNVHQDILKIKVSMERVYLFFSSLEEEKENKQHMPIDEIKLNEISFNYDSNTVLNKLSINLKAPCNIAIIGKTGSGKSTLANIIAGIYQPASGNIIYLKNNKILNCLPNISYCLQDGYLFDQSIYGNIKIANPNITIEKFNELVKICCLEDVIKSAENRPIGENGANLSGGERKRVRILQALSNDTADIYIFDELSASLDENTSKHIIENIMNMKLNKICIFIEHNLDISKKMKYIVNMDEF